MKKAVLVFAFLSCFLNAFSQDKILDKAGNEHFVYIKQITPDSVFYLQSADSLAGKVQALAKGQIFMITFKNGVKEVFNEKEKPKAAQTTGPDYFRLGQQEAKQNFKATGVFWSTFGVTSLPLFGPVAAVYTAPVVCLIPASQANITAPKAEYLQNPDYMAGYRKQARKKKFGQAASGFGLGLIPYSIFTIALVAARMNHP